MTTESEKKSLQDQLLAVQTALNTLRTTVNALAVDVPVPLPVPVPTPTPVPTPLPGKMRVGVNTWYLAPSWGFGTPWRDNQPDFVMLYASGGNPWSSGFLSDLRGFACIRFLEWAGTNWSRVSKWSERRLPGDPANRDIYVDQKTVGIIPGLAYEWMFDLCNRVGADCWVTLPVRVDDDFVTRFGALARQRLDSRLRLIVELSNETDSGQFKDQTQYAQDMGTALSLDPNKYYAGAFWVTLRTLQIGRIIGDRASIVRCGVGNSDLLRQSMLKIYKSTQHNAQGTKLAAIGMAAYFGSGADGKTYTLGQAKADIDALATGQDGITTYKGIAQMAAVPELWAYESGIHLLLNAATFAAKEDAGAAQTYLMDVAAKYGISLLNQYTDSSTQPNEAGKGAWGLKGMIGGPETPRSAAIKKWMYV